MTRQRTKKEIEDYVWANYIKYSGTEIAAKLNVKPHTIHQTIIRLGLNRKKDTDDILLSLFDELDGPSTPLRVVAKEFEKRHGLKVSLSRISTLLKKNGIKKPTAAAPPKEEMDHRRQFIIDNHRKMSIDAMAEELYLSRSTVGNIMIDERLTRTTYEWRVFAYYDKDEYIGEGTIYELSEQVGLNPSKFLLYKTPSSEKNSRRRLVEVTNEDDIEDNGKHNLRWTDEEIDFLKKNINAAPLSVVSYYIQRTHNSVSQKVNELGLSDQVYRQYVHGIYSYHIDGEQVAYGVLPDISKQLGVAPRTLLGNYVQHKNEKNYRGRRKLLFEGYPIDIEGVK